MNGTLSLRKPFWLNKKIDFALCREVKSLLRGLGVNTICEEARCPNLSQCFSKKIVTFMILGNICTRDCRFCNVRKGKPKEVDYSEPVRVAEAVKRLNLKYVVITSPTRDDLPDGGASIFSLTVKEIKCLDSVQGVEVLIPDFMAQPELVRKVIEASPTVVVHNLETVPSLYSIIRSRANYQRCLKVLQLVKEINPSIPTKSGIMLGLGEEKREVREVLQDLREVGCDFLTIGQYLPPSNVHYPVKRYVPPEEFAFWEEIGLKMGFKRVLSSPYVRSSYWAQRFLD